MTESLNPLLTKVKLPGRVFQLPSKGLFYADGVLSPSVTDAEIHVRPMSAITEIKLRSADLLFSNKIIEDVCAECAPEILKPRDLLAKDVDALFMFLIISTYGPSKSIKSVHDCEKAEMHDYDVNLEKIATQPNNQTLDYREMLYTLDLENGQQVLLRPISFDQSLAMIALRRAIIDDSKGGISGEGMEKLILADMLAVISGVKPDANDKVTITDQVMIREWLKMIPKKYIDQVITGSDKANEWGFNFKIPLVCKDCGKTYDHDLELNPVNFFNG